jgi:hypothetical protein
MDDGKKTTVPGASIHASGGVSLRAYLTNQQRRKRRAAGEIITASVTPELSTLVGGDQIQDGFSSGLMDTANYASTAGAISSVTATTLTVDGVAAAVTDTVAEGEVVAFTALTVEDDQGNTRVFVPGSTTVEASGAFTPADLFTGAIDGFWYDFTDASTMWQEVSRTTNPSDTDTVAYVDDLSGNANDAVQSTASKEPVFTNATKGIEFDFVDDELAITVPVGGWDGDFVVATRQGVFVYETAPAAGAWNFGLELMRSGLDLIGMLFVDGGMSDTDVANCETWFEGKGASIPMTGSLADFWRGTATGITAVKGTFDTSAVNSLNRAFYQNNTILTVPAIDCSNMSGSGDMVEVFDSSTITSIGPITNAGALTSLARLIFGCSGLTVAPTIDDTSSVTNWLLFGYQSGITAFPEYDYSAATSFARMFQNGSLTSLGANLFDTCPSTNYDRIVANCALDATSINNLLVSVDTAGQSGGDLDCDAGTNAAPSGAGATAVTNLTGKGWTVFTN